MSGSAACWENRESGRLFVSDIALKFHPLIASVSLQLLDVFESVTLVNAKLKKERKWQHSLLNPSGNLSQ